MLKKKNALALKSAKKNVKKEIRRTVNARIVNVRIQNSATKRMSYQICLTIFSKKIVRSLIFFLKLLLYFPLNISLRTDLIFNIQIISHLNINFFVLVNRGILIWRGHFFDYSF